MKRKMSCRLSITVMLAGLLFMSLTPGKAQNKPRARDLGVPFEGTPGPWNAITDVKGVEVGHVTLIEAEGELG